MNALPASQAWPERPEVFSNPSARAPIKLYSTFIDCGSLGDEIEAQVQYRVVPCDRDRFAVEIVRVVMIADPLFGTMIYPDGMQDKLMNDLIDQIEADQGIGRYAE
jgi:hypothetical protein